MVGARQALTGQTLTPRLPATAAALAVGEIALGQLRVITETIGALPASAPQPARDRADADLAHVNALLWACDVATAMATEPDHPP
jgi:hypothetical protein